MLFRTAICLGLVVTACGDSVPPTDTGDVGCVAPNCPDGGDVADTAMGPDTAADTTIATPPGAPTFSEIVPESPANSLTPEVKGHADAGSAVSVHLTNDCSDPSVGDGVADLARDFTVIVTVPSDATTSLYARATGAGGLSSGCVWLTDYAHDGVAPALTADAPTVGAYDAGGTTFTWRGTAEPGARVALALAPDADGACAATAVAEIIADTDGYYEVEATIPTDAVSFYGISAIDAAGNQTCDGPTPLVAPVAVRVLNLEGELLGGAHVFVSRDDGAPLSEATTQAGEALAVLVFAGVSVTVADEDDGGRWLQTHADVRPGEPLFFGVAPKAPRPTWVGDVEIIFPGTVAGAVDYTVQTTCDGRKSTTSSISHFFSVFDDCVSLGDTLSMVIVATDAMGKALAFTTTQLVLTDGYNPAVPGAWSETFDVTDVAISATDTPATAEVALSNVSEGVAYSTYGPTSLNLEAMSTGTASLETLPDFGDHLRLTALFTAPTGSRSTLMTSQIPTGVGDPAAFSVDSGSVVSITSIEPQNVESNPDRPEWAIASTGLPPSGALSRLVTSSSDGALRWTIVGPAANKLIAPMVPTGLADWAPSVTQPLVNAQVAWVTHDTTAALSELRALFGQNIYTVSFEDAHALVGDPALFGQVWQASATTCSTQE